MKHPASSAGELGELPAHPRTEEELKQWIANGVEESLTLDYKANGALAKEKRGEIAKDVSAIANSAGGVVIYGVSEYPKDSGKQHLPEKIDPIDDSQFTKEWLEHVIAGGVRPRILDLLVHPIRLARGGAVCWIGSTSRATLPVAQCHSPSFRLASIIRMWNSDRSEATKEPRT